MFAFLRQSTANQSRMVGPFIDDTDFKTLETGLTIANTDVKLNKGAAVGVDKNSGGATHRNNGMYSLTFNATDTDTVGELTGSIAVTGALIVLFKFWVLEENIFDALFGATATGFDANGRVDVSQWAGTSVAANNIAIKASLAKGTDITGFNDLSAAQVNTEADTALSDIRLNELMAVALASQPFAGSLFADLTEDDLGTQRFNINALEQAPSGGGGGDATAANQTTIINFVNDLESRLTAARATNLDNLDQAISSLQNLTTTQIGDAVLDEVVEGTLTLRQMLRIFTAVLAGKSSGGGTTTLSFRDAADAKNRVVAVVDANGNRTSVTTLDGS